MQIVKSKLSKAVLIILDGWGIAPAGLGNAISLAKTPTMDQISRDFPYTQLIAHGQRVGLPDNQDGNSEAGHMNIGAGRIVKQDAVYINRAIKDKTFFKNTAFKEALKHLKKYKTRCHIMGLLSASESAHADPGHLKALLELVRQNKVKNTFLHLFTDGRDSSQHEALNLIKKLEKELKPNEQIASITGRYYAMDRKKNWHNIKLVYNALVLGRGDRVHNSQEAITKAYNREQTDEYILPSVIVKRNKPLGLIQDDDIIIFFNLRSDRARELTKTFVQPNFEEINPHSFKRQRIARNIRFVAMTDFGPDLPYILTAFPSRDLQKTLPVLLKNKKQLYLAEAEKYSHMTYFFNGGYAEPVAGEKRVRIASPDVSSYDQRPEMSAFEIKDYLIQVMKKNIYDFTAVNFANPDMVGHTGNLQAGVKAVESVDKCLKDIIKQALKQNVSLIITADHGNIEEMINLETGEIDTKHSINPVPFILVDKNFKKKKLNAGILADIAPTLLNIMHVEQPKLMTGKNLLI
ncbi:MAG: 2,3-bisphosphoglycerate-independent phosphoglycerate mutase [Patescibacteria group bacterium]|nr:2,3-bisphosphoglycerate-independent phosphoglycerate mutase [Patescibacteria group bacterium]